MPGKNVAVVTQATADGRAQELVGSTAVEQGTFTTRARRVVGTQSASLRELTVANRPRLRVPQMPHATWTATRADGIVDRSH